MGPGWLGACGPSSIGKGDVRVGQHQLESSGEGICCYCLLMG